MNAKLAALLTLNALPKIGPVTIRRLIAHFGSAAEALAAAKNNRSSLNFISSEKAEIITNHKHYFSAHKELAACEKDGITIITADDPAWPPSLSRSADSPVLLYVKGDLSPTDQNAIAIVGSRRTTHYGRSITQQFSSELSQSGWTVISGLARGIDTEAHRSVVAAKGRTIAVLGSGLHRLYPQENRELAEEISNGHGAIISEFPLQQPPDKQTFPQRNRIVAYWANATLVTECPSRSGSLITASFAADAGKTVLAVPGPVDRTTSAGCNELIRDGAILVQSTADILQELQDHQLPLLPPSSQTSSAPSQRPLPQLTKEEDQILQSLRETPGTIDQIAEATQIPVQTISTTLLSLELKHAARQMAGQRYEALL